MLKKLEALACEIIEIDPKLAGYEYDVLHLLIICRGGIHQDAFDNWGKLQPMKAVGGGRASYILGMGPNPEGMWGYYLELLQVLVAHDLIKQDGEDGDFTYTTAHDGEDS